MMKFSRWTLAVCVLLLMAVPAISQSRNTGEIRGTVSAAGAVVPGATVTVTNIDTGESKNFITNQDGIYDTVSTPAGNYNITFIAKGFKKVVVGPVILQVDTITENASLEVGQVSETVTVEAGGPPLLETETSHMGAVLEAQTLQDLPQIGAGITGNDWANFNILLPGAGSSPTAPGSEGSGAYNAGDAISINGNLPNYANYLQDGGAVQLPVSNNVDNTLFEALQEVQVTTSSFSAEYGIGGAVFNQITKSGTNRFHGSAYEYFQNDMLNARPYFGIPNSTGTGFTPQKVGYIRYDEWGGSVGGPIIKNKLFFFFVRDKIYNNGAASATNGTTPTLAERGMGTLFPGAYDFSAPGLPTLYDPASCGTPGCTRTSFAAENTGVLAGVNAIPASRIDPVAAALLNYYPLPNAGAPGALTNNFSTILPTPNPNLRYFGRLDYDMSEKNRISFSISQKDNPGVNKYGPFPCPLSCFSGDIDGYNAQATDTWEITPRMVNEFRMAYTKQGNWFVPDTIGFNPTAKLGLQYSEANVFPQINVSGGTCCSQLAPGTNAIYIEGLYDPSDVVTLIRGKHILKFGIEVLMGDGDTTPWGNITSGNFTFQGLYTAQNGAAPGTTGLGVADFLLGDVQKWSATNQIKSYMRLKSPQAFVQDEFKVRPNLTLNLGLRYVATTGMSELHNSLGGFDPNIQLVCPAYIGTGTPTNPNGTPCTVGGVPYGTAGVIPLNGTLGSLWFAPQDNRNTLQKPIYDIFLPRVGFAWSITNSTVIRGGYGMYSYNFSEDDYGNGVGFGATTTSTGSASDPNNGTGPNPLVTLSEPANAANAVLNYVVGSPSAKNVLQYLNPASPSGQTYVPYNVSPGRIDEWQFSVEHQFARNYMASIAYVGSHGSNLQFPTDLNQILSPAGIAASAAAGSAIQADRPFPAWGNLSGYNYDGISNYNSLQATINKSFSNGLLFSFNYVWSHFLDDQDSGGWGSRGGAQPWQIGNNPAANYANSNFDIPNAFKGYISYDLPFGKGRPYLSGNSVLDEVVGGWRLAGTALAQSGNPFSIVMGTNENNTITGCSIGGTATGGDINNGCNWFPNVIGHAGVSNPGPNGWFNQTAFANASGAGTFAFGDMVRNSLRGPRLVVFNMSLAKDFSITEHVKAEFRSDWVNVFNHPSLNTPGQTCNVDTSGVCVPGGTTSSPAEGSIAGGNFGLINAGTLGGGVAVAPRSGQLSLRVTF